MVSQSFINGFAAGVSFVMVIIWTIHIIENWNKKVRKDD